MALGVSGSARKCERGLNVALLHYLLPDVDPDSVTDATLSITFTEVKSHVPELALYGLGPRGETETEVVGQQEQADAYIGTGPDGDNVRLSSSLVSTVSGPLPTELSLELPSLAEYVREQLRGGGACKYLALRIAPADYHGCEETCNAGCSMARYRVLPDARLVLRAGRAAQEC